jgi:hypothetical protein
MHSPSPIWYVSYALPYRNLKFNRTRRAQKLNSAITLTLLMQLVCCRNKSTEQSLTSSIYSFPTRQPPPLRDQCPHRHQIYKGGGSSATRETQQSRRGRREATPRAWAFASEDSSYWKDHCAWMCVLLGSARSVSPSFFVLVIFV